MSKLTLSVDENVIARAKRYARQHGTSVSGMVEAYLSTVTSPPDRAARRTPVLDALRGSLKKADIRDYRRHLSVKYR